MSCNHTYVNLKFQPRKDGTVIIIFSSLLLGKQGYYESRVETKFIVTYLSRLLQEKQGYFESKNILNYEVSLVCGKTLGLSSIKMQHLKSSIKIQYNYHQSEIALSIAS
jgi:hypothetical protein